jgi:hypothetical protein
MQYVRFLLLIDLRIGEGNSKVVLLAWPIGTKGLRRWQQQPRSMVLDAFSGACWAQGVDCYNIPTCSSESFHDWFGLSSTLISLYGKGCLSKHQSY